MPLKLFRKYPVIVTIGASLLITGTAMAAFGPSDKDENGNPTLGIPMLVKENLELNTQNLNEQSQQLDSHEFLLYRDSYTESADTEQSLLERLSIQDNEVIEFLRKDPMARLILNSSRKVRVVAKTAPDGSLIRLKAYLPSKERRHFQCITIERNADNNQLFSVTQTIPAKVTEKIASGKINRSLFATTESLDLPTNISYQLADIFENRIDFARDIHPGDSFQLIYETYEADGQPIGTGKILAAQFISLGRKHNAIWFDPDVKNFRPSYLTFDGKSLRTTFLAYPLEYTRISSQFGNRLHPIQKVWKNHNGTDFAAPTGTAIRTVGDGRVVFAGTKGGYGKTVIVAHDKSRTTLYAHMSRINVVAGQVLEQGEVIGAVGQTGWATGPHLHLEYHEKDEKKDPATLAAQTENIEITKELAPIFKHTVKTNSELIDRIAKLTAVKGS